MKCLGVIGCVLCVLVGRAKKGYAFLLVYALLCILLAFNVVGCDRTWKAAAGIR
jgi:hypothetical protein